MYTFGSGVNPDGWTKDDMAFCVIKTRMGHYCGYCNFPARPVKEDGYYGLIAYVPVHGGITYAETEPDGTMTYGFDCAHSGDDRDPKCRDVEWLKSECERMAEGIRVAAEYEDRYLQAPDNKQKAEVIDEYHAAMKERGVAFSLGDNLGAMIGVFCGNL